MSNGFIFLWKARVPCYLSSLRNFFIISDMKAGRGIQRIEEGYG